MYDAFMTYSTLYCHLD